MLHSSLVWQGCCCGYGRDLQGRGWIQLLPAPPAPRTSAAPPRRSAASPARRGRSVVPCTLRQLQGTSRNSPMDQHPFVQRLENPREKHPPLGGDARAHGASPRWEGRRARREASATPRSHPSLSKGLAGCAALQQRSSSVSPPQPTSPSPSLSATFLCNPRIDLQVL